MIRVPGERSRHPPQRRRARARNGVAPQSAGSPSPSRQQTGKTRKGNAGGASARPGFPGAAGARSFSAVGQVIPCPFGYLRGLLYPSHKVPHGPEPAQIGQSFFKTIEVVNRGIPHPPELHRERIARHHFRRYPEQ